MTLVQPAPKARRVPVLVVLSILAATGCARSVPIPMPRHYPALPPGPSASSAPAAFEPAPELTPLSWACRAAEPSPANALDDDCDGHVDGLADEGALLLAVAYPVGAKPELALRRADAAPIQVSPPPCDERNAFCTFALNTRLLARGRHALLARASADGALLARVSADGAAHSGDPGGASTGFPLVVSAQSRGKVSTYLATIELAPDAHMLGEVALP